MAKRLGVGLIGAGFIAKFHIRSWVSVRDADIKAICSASEASAREAASLAKSLRVGDPRVYRSATEMVADPEVDAIWIVSPNYTHVPIMEEIVAAIESGKGNLVGVACEKPLGRNVQEARRMLELAQRAKVLDGYLEDQIFTPTTIRGKQLLWERGAKLAGRPYLARAAEEHSGPHAPWFWDGELQGGGVMNDMMCHSLEVVRHFLTEPGQPRNSLVPVKITAHANCLKWQREKYAEMLSTKSDGQLDYHNRPSEDYARATVEFRTDTGETVVAETTTSWCFVGAGLRLSVEVLGPEYSLAVNSLDTDMKLFLSRDIQGDKGEDLVEKQNAETGLMPIVSNEENAYGYDVENRHMVQCFLDGRRPDETFEDGLAITELLMAAYMSADEERTVYLADADLGNYLPKVARGEWNPKRG